jgi:Ca2+-binding RTX toxin-like protein
VEVVATDAALNASVSQSFSLSVSDVNEAPTAVTLANTVTTLAENSEIDTGIKVADIAITDDALGSNALSLTGADASSFEIRGSELYYIGSSPNFETKSAYSVTVLAGDNSVAGSTPVSQNFSLAVSDVNEAPTAVTLANTVTTLAENSEIGTGIKVADIAITDDALGSNALSLTGADASSFEIRGSELYYIGSSPNFETKSSYSVDVVATDAALNASVSQSFSLSVSDVNEVPTDTMPPDAPTIAQVAGDNIVNSAEKTAGVTVSGIAEANSTLNITWGSTTQTATADASGNWSGAFSSAQIPTDGNTTITATTRDAAGNTSTAVTRSVLIDTLAPTAPAITNIGGADSTVSSVAGDAQVVGTAEANSTVTVRFGTTVLGTATTGSNGSWAYALTSANITTIGQGANKTITASAADAAGNTSLSASRTFAVDTLAPNSPSITNVTDNVGSIQGPVANGGSTDDTTPTFAISLTGTSAVAGDTVRLFNGSTQIATSTLTSNDITAGSVSITPTALAQGNYSIIASITDVAGNQSAASTARTFTLNTTSPTAPVINGFSNVSGNTLTLTGTAEAGSTVAILNGNTTLGTVVAGNNGSWSFGTTSLTNGTFNITASATNLAGNTSPLSAASNIIAGTTANNSLTGTNANNVLVGYAGNDSLSGDNGNDTLLGGDGSDTLLGGNGDDILVGGSGDDILTGGNGNDRFVYQAFSDRGTVGDSITDFNSSQDKLVLTDLFRSVNYSGSNPIADGYLRFTQSGTSTQVQIDQNGLTGGSNFNTLATLNNVTPGSLTIGTNVVI